MHTIECMISPTEVTLKFLTRTLVCKKRGHFNEVKPTGITQMSQIHFKEHFRFVTSVIERPLTRCDCDCNFSYRNQWVGLCRIQSPFALRFFFWLRLWFPLSQLMDCTELNRSVHTMRLRQPRQLFYSPLEAKGNRTCKSHSVNGPSMQVFAWCNRDKIISSHVQHISSESKSRSQIAPCEWALLTHFT